MGQEKALRKQKNQTDVRECPLVLGPTTHDVRRKGALCHPFPRLSRSFCTVTMLMSTLEELRYQAVKNAERSREHALPHYHFAVFKRVLTMFKKSNKRGVQKRTPSSWSACC